MEDDHCNYDRKLDRTSPVGIFPKGKSRYCVFDMAGNIWEWCADWYDSGYYKNSPDRNPECTKVGASRVYRGGSWFVVAGRCLAFFRDGDSPATATLTSVFVFRGLCSHFLLYSFTPFSGFVRGVAAKGSGGESGGW